MRPGCAISAAVVAAIMAAVCGSSGADECCRWRPARYSGPGGGCRARAGGGGADSSGAGGVSTPWVAKPDDEEMGEGICDGGVGWAVGEWRA